MKINKKSAVLASLVISSTFNSFGVRVFANEGTPTVPQSPENNTVNNPQNLPLPDELDYPKAKASYNKILKDLENDKNELAIAKNSLAEKQSSETKFRNKKQANDANLGSLSNQIVGLKTEIPALQNNNLNLESQIKNLQSNNQKRSQTLNDLNFEIENVESKRSDVNGRLVQQQNRTNELIQRKNVAQRSLNELEREIGSQNDKIKKHQSELKNHENKKANLAKTLQENKAKIAPLNTKKTNLETKIQNQKNRIPLLEAELPKLSENEQNTKTRMDQVKQAQQDIQGKITEKKKEIDQVKLEVEKAKAQVVEIKKQVDEINRQINQLKTQQANQKARIQDLENKIKETEAKIKDPATKPEAISGLKGQIAKLNQQKTSVIGNLDKTEARLLEVYANLESKRNQMDGANREVAKVEKKAEPIQNKIQQLQTALTEKNNQLQSLQNNLSQIQVKIKNVKSQKDNLLTQISSDQKELAQTVENLAKASAEIPNIENQIAKVNELIPKTKSAIADLQSKLKQLQNILPSAQQGFRAAQNELAENDQRINRLNQEYFNLTEQSRNLRNRFDQIQRDYQQAESQTVEMQNLISANNERIQYNQNLIPQLEQQVASLQREAQKLAQEIEIASKSVSLAQKKVKDRDAEFQKSTKLAEQTYTKLLVIKKKYQALLDEAIKLGSKLGAASAISGAEALGILEGDRDGLLLGALQGKILGLIEGFEKGKQEGQKQGQLDGKSHGSTVASVDPDASAEGQKFGLKVAQNEANLVSYVEARATQFKVLMDLPITSGPIEIINEGTAPISSNNTVSPGTETLVTSTNTDVSVNHSEMSNMALAQVPKKKPTTPVNTTLKICTDLSNTTQLHKAAPVDVVASEECSKLKYSMQTEECSRTYLKTFQTQWDLSYKKSFTPAAIKTCIVSYDEQFKLNQLVRFQEGIDQTYEMSFRQADKAAALANKKSIYLDSRLKAYKENIENLKAQAQQKGIDDENLKFSQSSVLSIEAIKLNEINEDLFQNEGRIPMELSLTIINHSSIVDSLKGEVQVRVIPLTSNLTVEHKTALLPLVSIPKSTQVELRQVSKLLFKNTVDGKEKVSLKVQVILPTGESIEKILETKL